MVARVLVLAAVLTGLLPAATHAADKFEVRSGCFVFAHAPAAPSGFCPDGSLLFEVESNEVSAEFEGNNQTLAFNAGSGFATGCVYETPLQDGAIALFSGLIILVSDEGELWLSFQMSDFFIGLESVFRAEVVFSVEGGTGKYNNAKGSVHATGLDFPFVDAPTETGAGVILGNCALGEIRGVLRLKE